MKTVWQMLQLLEGLVGTKDLDDWETTFVEEKVEQARARKGETTFLNEKQIERIEALYKRHFAG